MTLNNLFDISHYSPASVIPAEIPTAKTDLINRDLSSNELREWFQLRVPKDKIRWAVERGIVQIKPDGKYLRRNSEPRSIDEMPKQRRAAIHYRDKECAYCGHEGTLVVDHLIPFMAWPAELLWLANTSSNLVSACEECNASKLANFNDSSFKHAYPIVFECINCRVKEHLICGTVKVYCYKCNDISTAMFCNLPGIDCEGIPMEEEE